ncbi:MAG: hypothetical protein JWN74_2851 [Acidobacteriaceae bacterium]|nr:hypothetical protein [Acidobacteriaceae bacterium]
MSLANHIAWVEQRFSGATSIGFWAGGLQPGVTPAAKADLKSGIQNAALKRCSTHERPA